VPVAILSLGNGVAGAYIVRRDHAFIFLNAFAHELGHQRLGHRVVVDGDRDRGRAHRVARGGPRTDAVGHAAVPSAGREPDPLERDDRPLRGFAVGIMLYELLCNGQHPYPGAEPLVDEEIIDPKSVRPDLNNELAEFLRKACASNRAKRFDNAVEMEAELRRIRTDIGSASLLEPLPASRC